MANYTREQLELRTRDDLRSICTHDLGIKGMSKKTKGECIEAILDHQTSSSRSSRPAATAAPKAPEAPKVSNQPLTGIEFKAQSVMTKPSAKFGDRTTTTIHVSSGANSGNFPVAGHTIAQVGEFLREVLNLDKLSTGLVNGKSVDSSYVLKNGDNLEFLKPAGSKGC